MAAQSWPAQGLTLGIDEASPPGGTYTLIGQILNVDHIGGGEVGERDTTVLTSTVKSGAPTIPDMGETKVSVNFDPTDAVHKFLRTAKDTPPASGFNNYKATLNVTGTVTTIVFPAFVKSLDGINAGGVDESLVADITLRVTGLPTYVPV